MSATPTTLHAAFGIVLIAAGIVFDFAFVTTGFTESFKTDPIPYMFSWKRHVFELTRLYFFVLGFANIAFALLTSSASRSLDWVVFGLMAGGSVLFVVGGIWEALVGPVFKMEPPCYVVGAGIGAVLLALALEAYKVLFVVHFKGLPTVN